MLLDGSKLNERSSYESDICILGGGVAGIVLARELLGKFKKIILLESGGENYTQEAQELYAPSTKNKSYYPDPTYSRLRFLGGSSNHWENNTSPLDPMDFENRSWIPNSGWPISFNDLESFYPKAEVYCGVKGNGYDTDEWVNKLAYTDLVKGSKVLETGIAKAAVPSTRFYAAHGQPLVENSSIQVITFANVVDLDFDEQTQKIQKVFFETKPGLRHEVKAKAFVMCFGGIENARMLLTFNEKYKNKIGNYHDNVGRYFMDHPTVRAANFYPHTHKGLELYTGDPIGDLNVKGFLELKKDSLALHELSNIRMPLQPATKYEMSDGISSHHILGDAFSEGELPEDFGAHILNYVKDIDMVVEAVSRKAFDKKLFDDADDIAGYQFAMMLEQTPHRDNRIRLGDKLDPYGIARIEIDWEFKKDDQERMWRGLEVTANELGALSIGRLRLLKERSERLMGDQLGYGHHHMGTTRMSKDYKSGVVDAKQKVFGTNNFFIGGSSVFSTGGHVPPTLTIAAMSIRLAETILKEYAHG